MPSCDFDSLPNLKETRHTVLGLTFNVLVVGPTGIGKTNLINSLFDCDYGDVPDHERSLTNVNLRIKEFKPPNKTIDMKLTIIETKGFNNQLDTTKSYKPIVDYIEARYEDFLKDELTRFNEISDNRVHCCIYMISPIGQGLKPIDIVTMKHLHHRVCLVPVIGKSDILTKQEKLAFKEKVRQQIVTHGIEIYPADDRNLPFAIAASNDIINENGKRSRVRICPFGTMRIDVDSEFPRLRDLVLGSNLLSLIEHTNRVHYERYRKDVTSNDLRTFTVWYEKEKQKLVRDIERLEDAY